MQHLSSWLDRIDAKNFAKKMGKIEWEGNLDQMRTYDKWEENRNENEH